jgi:hypothetical protein
MTYVLHKDIDIGANPNNLLHIGDTVLIQSSQGPVDGGDIGQVLQPQQAVYHGIARVPVV